MEKKGHLFHLPLNLLRASPAPTFPRMGVCVFIGEELHTLGHNPE